MLRLKTMLAALLFLTAGTLWAQAPGQASANGDVTVVVENRHYTKHPVPLRRTPGPPGQVEVIYFFWYGSPWAAEIDADLRQWAATRTYPLRFTPSPVAFDNRYGMMGARIFFALSLLKQESRVGPLFMQAVAAKQVDLDNPKSILEWMDLHGIDKKKFQAALNNAQVRSRAATVPSVMRAYDVKSTPSATIDGTYHLRASTAQSPKQFLAAVKFMADNLAKGGPRP